MRPPGVRSILAAFGPGMVIAVYAIAALELAALLYFVAQYAFGPGTATSSGGAEMGLFFFTLLPMVVLSGALATFYFVRWPVLRGAAALVILAPLLLLGYWTIDDAAYRLTDPDYASGRGYFTSPAAQALAEAIVRGDPAKVAEITPATDVNQPGELNTTFLSLAMTRSDVDDGIVKTLLDAGADPKQNNGWPLFAAINRGDAGLVKLLLAAGADPNQRDDFGRPVFFGAMERPELLALLLAGGAKVDAVDDNGRTLLMQAARNAEWPAVTLLIAAGADVGAVAADGTGLAASIAFVRGRAEMTGEAVPPEVLALGALMRERMPASAKER